MYLVIISIIYPSTLYYLSSIIYLVIDGRGYILLLEQFIHQNLHTKQKQPFFLAHITGPLDQQWVLLDPRLMEVLPSSKCKP